MVIFSGYKAEFGWYNKANIETVKRIYYTKGE